MSLRGLLVLAWVLAAGGPVAAADAIVTDVRAGLQGHATRLVFEVTKNVNYKIFTLSNPYRVVIDLPEVGWRLPPQPLPTNTGLLKKLRYGLFQPGTSRIVIDVAAAPKIEKQFLLAPSGNGPYRLVVDLGRVSDANYQQAAKAKEAVQPAEPAPSVAKAAFVPMPPRPRKQEKPVIVIDAGHGGVDPGTIGVSGTYEKHITLAMARELKKQLENTGRFKVVLTRTRDIFVRLRARVAKGRDAGAALFISIHADAIKNRKTRGLSVYTLSEKASDKEAAALADKENKADLIAGINLSGETPEVTNILIDLMQRESMNQSARFATGLVKRLKGHTRVLRNTHRFAGFAVLKAPDVPSVLVELGFLSNRNDEKALRSDSYRKKLASGMVQAIKGYFSNIEEAYSK
ncbi:MAG: AMIN domain-containing protein [Rhodospirillaceae bacterium]|nr:AMIN domain-containing protein [Rhodospirillaceae bacterium]